MKSSGRKSSERCGSKVNIVDKSLANMYHVHTDLIKTNATLKEKAAINKAGWEGDILQAGKRCERESKPRKAK